MIAGVIDGHESHATFRRHCSGCLSRTIHTAAGDRTQSYHRHVTFQLLGDDWTLLLDAGSLFETMSPVRKQNGTRKRQWWDLSGFTTWPQVRAPLRIVRSVEDWKVRRQLDGQVQQQHTEWFWVTTLSAARAGTGAVVQLGHARWAIENEGFNELATRWHADHVYRHEAAALLVFTLLAMLCLNVFLAFYRRDLKPAARAASCLHVARQATAELYASPRAATSRGPPGPERPPLVHPLG